MLTHSLHYGLSVFEGVRAYKTEKARHLPPEGTHRPPVQFGAHLHDEIPFSQGRMMEAQRGSGARNNLESCYLRPIAFYGSGKMGVSPRSAPVHVSIAAWPWGAYLGEEGSGKGHPRQDRLVSPATMERHHAARQVATTYANSILASLEAAQDGFTTRRCCSTPWASLPKAPARTCS